MLKLISDGIHIKAHYWLPIEPCADHRIVARVTTYIPANEVDDLLKEEYIRRHQMLVGYLLTPNWGKASGLGHHRYISSPFFYADSTEEIKSIVENEMLRLKTEIEEVYSNPYSLTTPPDETHFVKVWV